MKQGLAAALAVIVFAAGIGVGYAAKKKPPVPVPEMYHGKDKQEAARALLGVALEQTSPKDSWERIGIGRVHYLGGHKSEGQAIFDALLAGKHEDSDIYRIARVYREAGEWDKAKPLFERYLTANPEEEKALAEVGSYYLLEGDRETAERYFDRSFAIEGRELWATLRAAGAYLGVEPQQ